VNIFRFRDRVSILDERSQRFLKTVAWLGGYVTPYQTQELGIRNSTTRVHGQLNDLESWRFIKRVAAYPTVYQVTKSVTRLLGADLSARRQHTLETIQTRLLTVNFSQILEIFCLWSNTNSLDFLSYNRGECDDCSKRRYLQMRCAELALLVAISALSLGPAGFGLHLRPRMFP